MVVVVGEGEGWGLTGCSLQASGCVYAASLTLVPSSLKYLLLISDLWWSHRAAELSMEVKPQENSARQTVLVDKQDIDGGDGSQEVIHHTWCERLWQQGQWAQDTRAGY